MVVKILPNFTLKKSNFEVVLLVFMAKHKNINIFFLNPYIGTLLKNLYENYYMWG